MATKQHAAYRIPKEIICKDSFTVSVVFFQFSCCTSMYFLNIASSSMHWILIDKLTWQSQGRNKKSIRAINIRAGYSCQQLHPLKLPSPKNSEKQLQLSPLGMSKNLGRHTCFWLMLERPLRPFDEASTEHGSSGWFHAVFSYPSSGRNY